MKLLPRIAIITLCSLAGAQTDPASDLVKRDVEAMGAATIAGDMSKVIDMTYSKVVEMGGGRAKTISQAEASLKALKEKGISITSFKAGDPSKFETSGSDLFTVVPTTVELKVPEGKLTGKSFVVGVSSDMGKTWQFLDGSIGPAKIRSLFPNLPPALVLPEKTNPVLEKKL